MVVLYTNADSRMNKWTELPALAKSNVTTVGVAEMWLSGTDHSPQNTVNQFNVYRQDSSWHAGGPVALLIREGLVHKESDKPKHHIHVFSLHKGAK